MYFIYAFLFVISVDCVLSNTLISPCKNEDTGCITESVNMAIPQILAGIPSLGVGSSDPLLVDKIESKLSILKCTFFNTTIIGYKDSKISNLKVSPDLKHVHFELNFDTIKMSGWYEINGHLIVLPVEGAGDYKLATGKYKLIIDTELKISTGADGKTHVAIKNYKFQGKPLGPAHFDFKNLFNGQKDLSDTVHKFAHERSQEILELLQNPVWNSGLKIVIANVNKYLKSVPLEELQLK